MDKATKIDNIFDIAQKPDGYYAYSRDDMLAFVPKECRKILEVGCGTGNFAALLKSTRDAEVWGIELCAESAAEAKTKVDTLLVGDFEKDTLPLPANYFDCIVFNDVLEHMGYPWIVLQKCHQHLQTQGFIVASVPNVRYYYTVKSLIEDKQWTYTDAGILDKTHLRFFTERSIREMFERCGFHVCTLQGINASTFPWKFRLFNWALGKRFEDMRFFHYACIGQKIS